MLFRVFITLLCLTFSTAACVYSPRDGESVFLQNEEVNFSGYLSEPGMWINLRAYDFENDHWVPFETLLSQSDPVEDAQGTRLYFWEGKTTIPSHSRYWQQDPDSHHVYARLLAVSGDISLHSFATDADDCIEREKDNGISAVIHHCRSPNTPVITIKRACGFRASVCCQGDAEPCRGETDCNSEGICTRAQWEAQNQGSEGGSTGSGLTLQSFGPEDLRGDSNPVQYPQVGGGGGGIEPPDSDAPVDHSICRRVGEKRCCASAGIIPGVEWCHDKYICNSPTLLTGEYRYGGGYVCGACWGGWSC